ncbi:DUF6241 domain-containing protein [Pseudogracilibacillus auburnensis]|uniref:DUF6241 domain-containing protein n=1 Tax=Pseudogracilibacillus auburnensis TaxID=1494959 RepID=UPI001A978AA2|nr:DUF6241 domain-containing protein [Pseudogracilibacillus auburnensis]MBO1004757.1 hypothetical protein [Pseudogracilibacillus auburnensis]
MYRIIIWSLIILVAVAIGAFAFIIISDSKKVAEVEKSRVIVEDPYEVEASVDEPKARDEDLNPFCEKVSLEDLSDTEYRNYIHEMSHQKVIADQKWGFYEITTERIDWLLDGLEQAELTDRKIYRDILQRWKEGNFTKVDQDHNAVWALKNGTVGKATGILSPKQEENYISKSKKKKNYCH